MFDVLKSSPLFSGLDVLEINLVINNVLHQIRNFSSNEVLEFSGETVGKAMILLEGKLRGEMVDFAGNSLKIEDLEPPQMVAAAFLYGPQNFFPVNLSALSEGKILSFHKKDFTRLLSSDPRLLNNYLNIVSGKVQFLSNKITFLSFKTIREKIAYYLLNQLRSPGLVVEIGQNQTALASMFGVARPSLARSISEMENEKIIRWERNEVHITNILLLKSIIGR